MPLLLSTLRLATGRVVRPTPHAARPAEDSRKGTATFPSSNSSCISGARISRSITCVILARDTRPAAPTPPWATPHRGPAPPETCAREAEKSASWPSPTRTTSRGATTPHKRGIGSCAIFFRSVDIRRRCRRCSSRCRSRISIDHLVGVPIGIADSECAGRGRSAGPAHPRSPVT